MIFFTENLTLLPSNDWVTFGGSNSQRSVSVSRKYPEDYYLLPEPIIEHSDTYIELIVHQQTTADVPISPSEQISADHIFVWPLAAQLPPFKGRAFIWCFYGFWGGVWRPWDLGRWVIFTICKYGGYENTYFQKKSSF